MSIADYSETVTPTPEDAELALASSRKFSRLAQHLAKHARHSIRLQVTADGGAPEAETAQIPAAAFRLFMDILRQMSQGNAVTLIPYHAELTTQEAAEILNVSRPFVIKLIEDKQLPHRKVGTHRRILFSDLMNYKRQIDRERLSTLDELAKQAQALNMGY